MPSKSAQVPCVCPKCKLERYTDANGNIVPGRLVHPLTRTAHAKIAQAPIELVKIGASGFEHAKSIARGDMQYMPTDVSILAPYMA
jgi:hypothetical protein